MSLKVQPRSACWWLLVVTPPLIAPVVFCPNVLRADVESSTTAQEEGEEETDESVSAETEQTETKKSAAAPLSVAPLDHVDYPQDRPDWLNSAPQLDEMPHRWIVVSGPSESREESQDELKVMQRAAVETYLSGLPGASEHSDFFEVTDEWIERNLISPDRVYSGTVKQEGLTRYEDATELVFDHAARAEIMTALENVQVQQRLGAMGVLVFAGLMGLICSSAVCGSLSRRAERHDKNSVV